MKIKLSNTTIKVKVKDVTRSISYLNYDLKNKVKFLDADESEIETIMNVKFCKMLMVELYEFEHLKDDIIILMRELFDEEISIEELIEIEDKLVNAYEQLYKFQYNIKGDKK